MGSDGFHDPPDRAERALLGALMTRATAAECPETLRPDDFGSEQHRRIYRAMLELEADESGSLRRHRPSVHTLRHGTARGHVPRVASGRRAGLRRGQGLREDRDGRSGAEKKGEVGEMKQKSDSRAVPGGRRR